jgi:hypothetical protein
MIASFFDLHLMKFKVLHCSKKNMMHSFTRYRLALVQCLTLVQADPLRSRQICAVPCGTFHTYLPSAQRAA